MLCSLMKGRNFILDVDCVRTYSQPGLGTLEPEVAIVAIIRRQKIFCGETRAISLLTKSVRVNK